MVTRGGFSCDFPRNSTERLLLWSEIGFLSTRPSGCYREQRDSRQLQMWRFPERLRRIKKFCNWFIENAFSNWFIRSAINRISIFLLGTMWAFVNGAEVCSFYPPWLKVLWKFLHTGNHHSLQDCPKYNTAIQFLCFPYQTKTEKKPWTQLIRYLKHGGNILLRLQGENTICQKLLRAERWRMCLWKTARISSELWDKHATNQFHVGERVREWESERELMIKSSCLQVQVLTVMWHWQT